MKKTKLFAITLFFLSSFTNISYSITLDNLIDILSSPDDHNSSIYAHEMAMNNLPLLPQVLLVPSGNPVARQNALGSLMFATRNNILSKESFLSILINQIQNIQIYSSSDYINDELFIISNMISYISYYPENYTVTSIDENYSNADLIITQMKEHDLIKNNGIKNSLAKKYENSLKSLKKGNKTPAINQLEAAKNEINAQSGKGIDTTAANILIRYTDNLIAHINSNSN